jgi:hypothetical protein
VRNDGGVTGPIDPRLQNPSRVEAERRRADDLRRQVAHERQPKTGRRWWQLWKRWTRPFAG